MRHAILIFALLATSALADIDAVKRAQKDFSNYPMHTVSNVRVTTARVAMVNYGLIARDFPQMARSGQESEDAWRGRVDAWVIRETAFILEQQAQQTTTNTKIETNGEKKAALRPTDYGRAHIIPVEGGLMDAKGTGTPSPRHGHHSDGLSTLGESIREYIYEKAVAMLVRHAGVKVNTVGNYGVVAYGFNVIHQDGSQSAAGYILRQAHQRSPGVNSSLAREDALKIELMLRKYGLTSSGETFHCRETARAPRCQFDYTNVQGTDNKSMTEIIDFGAYLAVAGFDKNLVSNYDIGTPVVEPGQPGFVAPDPAIRIPLEQWGPYGKQHDPKMDKPFVWSHELARAFAEGRADRGAMDTHIHNLLGPFAARLNGRY
jgi:hypothetical protein